MAVETSFRSRFVCFPFIAESAVPGDPLMVVATPQPTDHGTECYKIASHSVAIIRYIDIRLVLCGCNRLEHLYIEL